jgi:hypothetical protein
MNTFWIIIAAVIAIAVICCDGAWQSTQWNSGVNIKPTQSGFVFDVPTNGHVNSIQQGAKSVKLRQTVTLTFRLKTMSGKPIFKSLDTAPAPPALKPNFRIMFQRKGDDWTCSGGKEHYRWWATGANCAFLQPSLDTGTLIYSIKITPQNFSNCWGKPATQYKSEFKACLANLDNEQITWGGGNSFAHGINTANGQARYELFTFKIQ